MKFKNFRFAIFGILFLNFIAFASSSEIPELILPENHAAWGMGPQFADWTDVNGATSYELHAVFPDNSNYYLISANSHIYFGSKFWNTKLEDGNYFWQVRAAFPGGPGAWSESRSLARKTIPDLNWPLDESNIGPGGQIVDWEPIKSADGYYLNVKRPDGLKYNVYSKKDELVVPAAFWGTLLLGNYEWKVQAVNSGDLGKYSITRTFTKVNSHPNEFPILKVFISKNIDTYIVGDKCTGGNCCDIGPLSFENNGNFKGLEITSPDVNNYEQKLLVKLGFNDLEVQNVKNKVNAFVNEVKNTTGGAINLQVEFIEISGTAGLSPYYCGLWPASWNMDKIFSPYINHGEDFVMLAHSEKDKIGGINVPMGAGGLAFGEDYGIGGAGYSAVAYIHDEFFLHEWLHQLDSALEQSTGIPDIYSPGGYPGCNEGANNKYLWFPNPDTCQCDPDYIDCSNTDPPCGGSCSSPLNFYRHMLKYHFHPKTAIIGNHCRDGMKNFTETGLDCGGNHCQPC